VPAHDGRRWNDGADTLAKKHAKVGTSSKRAEARNPRMPTVDVDRLYAILNNPNLHPEIDA
jgi:hypothetical protein